MISLINRATGDPNSARPVDRRRADHLHIDADHFPARSAGLSGNDFEPARQMIILAEMNALGNLAGGSGWLNACSSMIGGRSGR